MRNASESLAAFQARVSKDAQDDDDDSHSFHEPGWHLTKLRDRGSIHSDRWTGVAADLAERDVLAVFPVGGWWKERYQLKKWQNSARYALVVSIQTPETEVDIYTPVANMIAVATPVTLG